MFTANFVSKLAVTITITRNILILFINFFFFPGLFENDHMPYVIDRMEDQVSYPSIREMTELAIKILSRSPKGFFLLVEGNSSAVRS